DRAVPGDEDRPDLVPAHDDAGRSPVRLGRRRLEVPGSARSDAVALLPELPRLGLSTATDDDERVRCAWAGDDPAMVAYHDDEWGVPLHDDRRLFEMLTLEGAQAGLSWSTILRKRAGYRRAFGDFDPAVVAVLTDRDVERLLGDPSIVRHRGKIESTISNAA